MLVCSWEWLPPVNRSDSSLTTDKKLMLFSPHYSSTEMLGVKCLQLGCGDCCFIEAVRHHRPVVLVQIQQTDGEMLIYSKGPQWCNVAVSVNTQEDDFTVTKYLDPSSYWSSSLYQKILKKIRSHHKRNDNCEHKVWDATCKPQKGGFWTSLLALMLIQQLLIKVHLPFKKRYNDENVNANSSYLHRKMAILCTCMMGNLTKLERRWCSTSTNMPVR